MTLELPTGELAVSRALSWMSPESGLWVANRDGEYLGMIERVEGRYRASDARGRSRGTHDGLGEAQFAVDRQRTPVGRDPRELVMLRATIILTGFTTAAVAFGIFQLVS